MQNPHSTNILLKIGYLDKKSDRGRSWAKRFCIINTKDFRYYYSESDHRQNFDNSLGTISLKHIFSIIPLKEGEVSKKFGFVINTGNWYKKNVEMGIREFYFAAESNDDLETWTTYIGKIIDFKFFFNDL